MGAALVELGPSGDGLKQYQRALLINPNHLEARINLATLLLEQGKQSEALAEVEAALKLVDMDQSAFTHYSMGVILAKCGLNETARRQFEQYLARDPEDQRGARLWLAGLGFESAPEKPSNTLLSRLYNSRATYWDIAAAKSDYCAVDLVVDAVGRLIDPNQSVDIMDAGCGTGLVGMRLRNRARRLEGIDLSAAMLERCKLKGVYDELHQGDLVSFLAEHPNSYDVITCAATLIHFGDLRPAFEAASRALRHRGFFVFTTFCTKDEAREDITVAVFDDLEGCFAHSCSYVTRVAENADFAVDILERRPHEHHKGKPRMGIIAGLRRS
jgi:predicted TPR repeat methyltransferase